jgi:DNA-binding MarR family transcriptional regulator
MPAAGRSSRRPSEVQDAASIVIALRRVVRALELFSQEVRRDFGLTAPQLWAVKTLARSGPLTTGDLATALLVRQSTTSLLIQRLERRGLVRRVRQRDDRRFVRVELTERGEVLAASAPAAAQGRLLHGLEGMDARRVRRIRRALEDIVEVMEAESVDARFFFAEA